MPDLAPDRYAEEFDPGQYLRQYYSLPQLAADDAALFRRLCGWLAQTGRPFDTAMDVGCGPTIHNTFAIAPHARRIDLADYLPANLAEIRRWLDHDPDAHDWDPLFRGVLECEGADPSTLEARKALYRGRVGSLHACDLREPRPLGRPAGYDLVTSFFCAECLAADRAEWEVMIDRIIDVVSPDGNGGLFLAAMRDCSSYRVLGRTFPSVPLVEGDFREALGRRGFAPDDTQVIAVPAPDWAEDGFDRIILVSATRRPSP